MKALRWMSPGPYGTYALVEHVQDGQPAVRLVWAPPGRRWGVLSHRTDLGHVSAEVTDVLDQTAAVAPGGWWR